MGEENIDVMEALLSGKIKFVITFLKVPNSLELEYHRKNSLDPVLNKGRDYPCLAKVALWYGRHRENLVP